MNINRNMRHMQRIYEQTTSGKQINRPSQDPLVASRSLRFRTRLSGIEQHQQNTESGNAWMNVSEAAFFNLLRGDDQGSLFGQIKDELLRAATNVGPLDYTLVMMTNIANLVEQIGLEMNQTYAGRFVFSGWRTEQPPILMQPQNGISHVVEQTFSLRDVERNTTTFQRFPASVDPELMPVMHRVDIIKLPFRNVNFGTDTGSAAAGNPALVIGGNLGVFDSNGGQLNVIRRSINDTDAYLPGPNEIHYIIETGELVLGRDMVSVFENDVTVRYEVSDLQQGDLNPLVYFNAVSQLSRFAELNRFPVQGNVTFDTPISFPISMSALGLPSFDITQSGLNANANGTIRLAYNDITNLAITGVTGGFVITEGTPPEYGWTSEQVFFDQATGTLHVHPSRMADFQNITVTYQKDTFGSNDTIPTANPAVTATGFVFTGHFPMEDQPIYYEFSPGSSVQVNSLARNVITDMMFADLRRLIEFAESIVPPDRRVLEELYSSPPPIGQGLTGDALHTAVTNRMTHENAMIRSALNERLEHMIRLMDGHSVGATREHTHLGTRMRRVEMFEIRLEQDEGNITRLKSDNEDVDMTWALLQQATAEAAFQGALRIIANNVQMSLVQFI